MNMRNNKLKKDILDGLLAKKDLTYLRNLLIEFKNRSGSQDEAYAILLSILRSLRENPIGKIEEDDLLELMDIASGYCNERARVWE